jgi:hypothetical protein
MKSKGEGKGVKNNSHLSLEALNLKRKVKM